jgi:hypothetical protein
MPQATIIGQARRDYERRTSYGAGTPGPTAVDDDGFETDDATPLEIEAAELLANDTDPNDYELTITAVGSPVGGTVDLDGTTITFTPTGAGDATFVYTISNGNGGTDTATVEITVSAA